MKDQRPEGLEQYDHLTGGWDALNATAKTLAHQQVVSQGTMTLLKANEPEGFDCPHGLTPNIPRHSSSVKPGREQKRENGSTEEVTPDALAIAGPTETPAEKSLNSADPPASDELHRHDQAAAISAEPVHSEDAENDGNDKVDREEVKVVEAADPALSGTAAHDATNQANPARSHRASKDVVAGSGTDSKRSPGLPGRSHCRRDEPR